MPELTDDQLDGLFRKSAEEFDPPFDPAAWQDMKTRLDTNEHTTPAGGALFWKNMLRWGLPVVLLLLLTGGGWLVYQKTTAKGTTAIDPARLAETKPRQSAERPFVRESDLPGSRTAEPKEDEVQKSANRNESIHEVTNSVNRLNKLTERPTSAHKPTLELTRSPVTNRATTTYESVTDGRLLRPKRSNRPLSEPALLAATNGEMKTARPELITRKGRNTRVRKVRNGVPDTEAVALVGADYSTTPTTSFLNTKRQDTRRREGMPLEEV